MPQELAAVHPIFYIFMLNKCMDDPSLIQILYRQVYKLTTKEVALVKVVWRNQLFEEVTWEAEEDMMNTYPDLFELRESTSQGDNSLLSNLLTMSKRGCYFLFDC